MSISSIESDNVLQQYMTLLWGKSKPININSITSKNFVGPSSVSLQLSNLIRDTQDTNVVSIHNNYAITDKADGLRKLLFINTKGRLYLIDTNMNIQFTGTITENKELYSTILDGEHIMYTKTGSILNLYAAFDIYFINGKDVRDLNFTGSSDTTNNYRWNILNNTINKLNAVLVNTSKLPPIRINIKKFYDVNDKQTIFMACDLINKQILTNQYEYETDGFIFTPKNYGVGLTDTDKKVKSYKHTWELSFKWKPAEFNTIDFLLSTKKTATGTDFIGNRFEQGLNTAVLDQIVQYKTAILRVGYDVKKHG